MPSPKDLPASVTANSLRSLTDGKADGITKGTLFLVDPELIEFEPDFNIRNQDDTWEMHVERLFLAMKAGASIPPIDVRVSAGKIICIDGHGRTTAALKMREEFPDYKLQARQFQGNEQERVLHMLGTGSGQKPLTPLEQGLGFLRLIRYGMTEQEIATKLGISRVTVDNNLQLANAPMEVQELVRQGAVSSTTAREAIKQGPEGVKALKQAASEAATAPAVTTKNGKKSTKKKVTAKKLKGTAAEKKPKPKKPGPKKTVKQWNKKFGKACPIPHKDVPISQGAFEELLPSELTPGVAFTSVPVGVEMPIMDDEIMVKVKKADAQAAVDFIKGNAPEDAPALKEFAAALEMMLL